MKTFISVFVVMVVVLVLTSAPTRGQGKVEGTYVIFNNDQKIETDEYTVVPGEKYSDDIRSVGADEQRRVAKLICSKGSLESYEQTLNGLPATKATNDGKFFKLYQNEATVGMFQVEENILFLDPNIYTQYAFLIRVFKETNKEKTRFNVCVPQAQDFLYVDIERHGTDDFRMGEKTITLSHYRITIGKKDIVNCWTDGDRLIGLYIASKSNYVADAGYDQLYAGLKKFVNRAM